MDPQDWINLQQLLGRGPQPWSLPPETPPHIALADALEANGQGQRPVSGITPNDWADALDAYGKQGQPPQLSDEVARFPTSGAPDIQPALLSDSISAGSPGPSGSPPSAANASASASLTPASGSLSLGSSDPATASAEPSYAMSSPANADWPWQVMADQNAGSPTPPPAKPSSPAQPPPPAIQTKIDPIPGYDETGNNAWRASNDKVFLDAVNNYNTANGYRPGDPGYWTADMLKAQAMVESGGDQRAFLTDPLQVNSHLRDWDDKKATLLGLTKGQAMTPQISAGAALGWLKYKGWGHSNGNSYYLGDPTALQNYNGRTVRVRGLPNVTFSELYAANIMQLTRDALAARNRMK